MLHFSLHINGNTICDVKIRNIGPTSTTGDRLYHWCVTEKETSEDKTITGQCEHHVGDGAMILASRVLELASHKFIGKPNSPTRTEP